jgi:hypothetical protein
MTTGNSTQMSHDQLIVVVGYFDRRQHETGYCVASPVSTDKVVKVKAPTANKKVAVEEWRKTPGSYLFYYDGESLWQCAVEDVSIF